MKTDDLDLGQKVKILNFSYEKMNSKAAIGQKHEENWRKIQKTLIFLSFFGNETTFWISC